MKNLSIVLVIIVAGLMAGSCSSLKVTSDLDSTVDFSKHKDLEYWGWAEDSDEILNRFDKERIEEAFGGEFRKRGIEPVEKGEGDIIVSLFIVTEQKTQTTANTTNMGGGYGGYYGYGPGYGWGGGHSTTTFSEYDYVVGTLIISVYDATDKQLIWESVGKGEINENPKKREEGIIRAAAKMMAPYPVAPMK